MRLSKEIFGEQYINYIIQMQNAMLRDDYKTNNKYSKKLNKLNEKYQNEEYYKDVLNELMKNANLEISSCAAVDSLRHNYNIERAINTLKEISSSGDSGIIGFSAGVALEMWLKKLEESNINLKNMHIGFNTIEEAFYYNYSCDENQIIQIVEKNEYSFVKYSIKTGFRKHYAHFIKKDGKWKIILSNEINVKIKNTPKGIDIIINRIEQLNIMVVCVEYTDVLEETLDISDSINSEFMLEIEKRIGELTCYSKTAIIENVPKDYYLIIEGEKIEI